MSRLTQAQLLAGKALIDDGIAQISKLSVVTYEAAMEACAASEDSDDPKGMMDDRDRLICLSAELDAAVAALKKARAIGGAINVVATRSGGT